MAVEYKVVGKLKQRAFGRVAALGFREGPLRTATLARGHNAKSLWVEWGEDKMSMNLLEFSAAGGRASIFGQPLVEMTRRQLRYLFAVGAFAKAKEAGAWYKKGGVPREQLRGLMKTSMQGAITAHKQIKTAAFAQLKFLGQNPKEIMGAPRRATAERGRLRDFRVQLRSVAKEMTKGAITPMEAVGQATSGAQSALHGTWRNPRQSTTRRRG